MLTARLKPHLESFLDEAILQVKSVSGGDISTAFVITTTNQQYFLKVNNNSEALQMFKAEADGLKIIAHCNVIKTPKVYHCGEFEGQSFILLEFITAISAKVSDMQLFGRQLAELHQLSRDQFGLEHNNYIGSLSQSNTFHNTWIDFYINERLLPQLVFAKSQGLLSSKDIPLESAIYKACEPLFQNIKPTVLHGDLWRGNYLISQQGDPYLIDPAVYFGHHEVDIAMTKLFGGFGESFYNSYHEILPKSRGFDARIEIYQLYYLLVHLNLFGSSYYPSVKRILNAYF